MLLSQVEHEIFDNTKQDFKNGELKHGEWRTLTDDRSIIVKKADKGSYVVVWDRNDYVLGAEKQLSDPKVHRKYST